MSIILKGIDPKTDYGLCILTISGELITANGKHIQAIQIPKGHGRLIDESNWTTHEVLEPMGNGQYEEVEVAYKGDIDNAPTILEAED